MASNEVAQGEGRRLGRATSRSRRLRYRYEIHLDPTVNAAGVQTTPTAIATASVRGLASTAKATDNILVGIGFDDRRMATIHVPRTRRCGIVHAQADRPGPGVLRLEVRQLGRPDRRQDEAAVLSSPARVSSWTTTSTRKAWRSRSTAACSSAPRYNFWLDEAVRRRDTRTPTPRCVRSQIGVRLPIGIVDAWSLAAALLRSERCAACAASSSRQLDRQHCANGNTTIGPPASACSRTLRGMRDPAEFNGTIGSLPLQRCGGKYAQNQDRRRSQHRLGGRLLLRQGEQLRTWEVGASTR